jgi:hypothetical protein
MHLDEWFFLIFCYGFLFLLLFVFGFGLRAVVVGKMQWKRDRLICGTRARLLGLLCMALGAPLPIWVIIEVIRNP